jgi:hypothetical protein
VRSASFVAGLVVVVACGSRTGLYTDDAGVPAEAGGSTAGLRLLAPLSTSTVTSQTPTLHFQPGTSGAAVIETCKDRACAMPEESFTVLGGSAALSGSPLSPGVHYWRASFDSETTAVWELFVGARSAPTDTSWGSILDVNGDGLADLAIDAVSVGMNAGTVYVHEGSPSGVATTPASTLAGPDGPEGIFAFVANAGDLNGDGFADVAVGATGLPTSATPSRVHVYFGSASGLPSQPSITLVAPDGAGTRFGVALAGVGDVNGDGYGDLVVGAPSDGAPDGGIPGAAGPGAAFVYLGGPQGPALGYTLEPPEPSGSLPGGFGSAVASAGDVDGFGDFVVSAPGQGVGGEAYVYRGSPSRTAPPVATRLTTTTTGEDPKVFDSSFGEVVACADDVNGDGYADLIVTVGWTNDDRVTGVDTASNNGRIYVYLGGPSGIPDVPATEVAGPGTFAFGGEAASAGDVNGDGYADLVFGAFGDGHTASVTGNAFVYPGGASGLASAPQISIVGPDAAGFFGVVSSSHGDLDGDGYADVVVAAYEAQGAAGRVYVFPGSASGAPATPTVTLTGPSNGNFGSTLACRPGGLSGVTRGRRRG